MKLRRVTWLLALLSVAMVLGYFIINLETDVEGMAIQITKTRVKLLRIALEQYHRDHGQYPSQDEGLLILAGSSVNGRDKYIDGFPLDSWGRKFIYRSEGSAPQSYFLYSKGPSGIDHGGQMDNIK